MSDLIAKLLSIERNTKELAAQRDELRSKLSAETQRRQAAEALVDAANRNSPDEQCNAAAFYRAKYPKETAT